MGLMVPEILVATWVYQIRSALRVLWLAGVPGLAKSCGYPSASRTASPALSSPREAVENMDLCRGGVPWLSCCRAGPNAPEGGVGVI